MPRRAPALARRALPPIAALALVVAAALGPAPAAGRPPGPRPGPTHLPPVAAPVVDPFRPPPQPWAAGNRGLTYAPDPGAPVRASAPGEVAFAGPVAGTLAVTVLHADGLRTSYSLLATMAVVAGERVAAGQVVGTAGPVLHFGVRDRAGAYLDPADLLAGRRPPVRLVPGVEEGRPALVEAERRALAGLAAGAVLGLARAAGEAGAGALGERLAVLDHYRRTLDPAVAWARVGAAARRWLDQRGRCTPPGEAAPTPPGRRVAVLVAGLGSTSEGAAVDRVDTAALGYAGGDVVRFSYAGGRVPDAGDGPGLAAIGATPYDRADSQGDLATAGARLAALLAAVARAHPGVPVDVIAHSQGGVVARLALASGPPGGTPGVATVVTLGSPHQGADLATAAAVLADDAGRPPAPEVAVAGLGGIDARSPAVAQLAEHSPVVADLARAPVPPGVRLVSVAARGDVVVPSGRTVVPGHPHVVVPVVGVGAHDELPGHPATTREVALAVAGRPPTCASLGSAAADLAVGEATAWALTLYGAHRALIHGRP